MSIQCDSVRVCLQCGFQIGIGSYCDKVKVRQKNGRIITRYLHGGPCTMAFRLVPGNPDPLRQIHRSVHQQQRHRHQGEQDEEADDEVALAALAHQS
jgi:hypothetical protein